MAKGKDKTADGSNDGVSKADFMCKGEIDGGCCAPCYLTCAAAGSFGSADSLKCILGYKAQWIKINKPC